MSAAAPSAEPMPKDAGSGFSTRAPLEHRAEPPMAHALRAWASAARARRDHAQCGEPSGEVSQNWRQTAARGIPPGSDPSRSMMTMRTDGGARAGPASVRRTFAFGLGAHARQLFSRRRKAARLTAGKQERRAGALVLAIHHGARAVHLHAVAISSERMQLSPSGCSRLVFCRGRSRTLPVRGTCESRGC